MKDLKLNILIKSLLYWYIFVFLSTEVLSYVHLLDRIYIILAEGLFWIFFLFSHRQEILQTLQNINFHSKIHLLILTLFLLTFIQGFLSAPNSADSMVYHLPRVMYWVQEKTLFQDTIRNVHDYLPPFGHYILLHLYLIFGNDRLLFFSPWIAYVSIVIISGLIARQLGVSKQLSGLTSLLVASIPVAVLQASGTKMEIIITAMVVLATYLAIKLREQRLFDYLLFSFCIGLGALTQQIFLIYSVIPLGIVFVRFIKNKRTLFLLFITLAIVVSLTQARFITQSLSLYGHIAGSDTDYLGQTNQNITPLKIVSNLIKNTSLHLPFPFFAKEAENTILFIHNMMGLNVNDCSITFCDEDFRFRVTRAVFPQEDVASNTIHLFLIFAAGFILVKGIIEKKINQRYLIIYGLTMLSYIAFSAAVKWQPFHSRFHLPFFVIGTISSILILSRLKKGTNFIKGALFLSFPLALILIFFNVLRPYISYTFFYDYVKGFTPSFRGIPQSLNGVPQSFLTKPRDQQYFNSRPYYYKPYLGLANVLDKENFRGTVAFNLPYGFEYPLWVFLKKNNFDIHVIPITQKNSETIIISAERVPLDKSMNKCVRTDVDIEYSYICVLLPKQ